MIEPISNRLHARLKQAKSAISVFESEVSRIEVNTPPQPNRSAGYLLAQMTAANAKSPSNFKQMARTVSAIRKKMANAIDG